MTLSYDRIVRKRNIVNKSDIEWSWSTNMPCEFFKVAAEDRSATNRK